MTNIPLTVACGPYDHMEALSRGIVQPLGIDVTYLGIQSPPEIFARMIKTNAFDISEMSLSSSLPSSKSGGGTQSGSTSLATSPAISASMMKVFQLTLGPLPDADLVEAVDFLRVWNKKFPMKLF